ncbi:MvaI/BcnI family restriction endonuclease [Vibrio rumoiensis]|uniref:MvaI/BcnI family restriction endonuclease n=1 Tax=Vibrio rumoiensis TaxID=76258 RepID=UPI003749AC33
MMDMEVVLEDKHGNIAASWSIERLMNCWGAKHNEVVYVPADKLDNKDEQEVNEGYKYKIKFSDVVLWCKQTTVENLVKAIHSGTIYLDPAPKYCPTNLKNNKRRSQWRINDIYKAADELYSDCELIDLSN